MIDVKQPVRKAYYDLLNGALSYAGNLVPVSDDIKKMADTSTIYVILSNQTGTDSSTFQTFDSDETIVLDIVYKAGGRASKEAVDNIAGQILGLVLPAPGLTGLISGPGVQINCVKLSDDRYMTLTLNSSNSVIRRLITFKQHIRQTQNNTPVNGIKGIMTVKSLDFSSATGYINNGLLGRTYALFLNDTPKFLEYGTDWAYDLVNGGFIILLPNFNTTLNNYTIYVLLT